MIRLLRRWAANTADAASSAMWLLGQLWRRLMRRSANAMRLLGRLMRLLMRAADEGD